MSVLWDDAKIGGLCEPGTRLVNPEFSYMNRLIVEDMRNDYERALAFRSETIGQLQNELRNTQAQIAKLEAAVSYLSFFHGKADFGPADAGVVMAIQRAYEVTGKRVPEEWRYE